MYSKEIRHHQTEYDVAHRNGCTCVVTDQIRQFKKPSNWQSVSYIRFLIYYFLEINWTSLPVIFLFLSKLDLTDWTKKLTHKMTVHGCVYAWLVKREKRSRCKRCRKWQRTRISNKVMNAKTTEARQWKKMKCSLGLALVVAWKLEDRHQLASMWERGWNFKTIFFDRISSTNCKFFLFAEGKVKTEGSRG